MATDVRTIAVRLGIEPALVRRLQARGYLLRLDLTEREIRERLFRAHLRFARSRNHALRERV